MSDAIEGHKLAIAVSRLHQTDNIIDIGIFHARYRHNDHASAHVSSCSTRDWRVLTLEAQPKVWMVSEQPEQLGALLLL